MKRIKFFILIFCVLSAINSNAQDFVAMLSSSKEPIEGVNAVYFINDKPIEIVRSNFKGEIYFKNFAKWDSVIFFKLGMRKIIMYRTNFNKRLLMDPIQNQLDEVLITGQIIPGNRYQSPFKMKYFTAEEIKNKNSVSLADFLQSENNYTVTQDPILGTKVSLNGMSGSDLKLMIDGIPVAGRLNGNIDYSQILLANVERIETVDGPMSTIYGTNATGGVINLTTKTGIQSESSVQANLYAESVGVLNLNAYYNTTKEGHRVSIGVHRNVFLGWDPYSDSLKNVIKPLWRDVAWNPKEQVMVNTSYYVPISKKTNLHFKINGFWETITNKLNPSSSQQVLVNDEYYKTVKFNIGGNSNSIISKHLEWQNYSNFNYFGRNTDYFNQNLKSGEEYFLKTVKEEILNVFGRTQIKHEFPKSDIKLLYGADYNMDIGFSEKLDTSASSVRDLSLFIMCNTKIGKKLLIQPGLRYSFNNISTTPISHTINFRYELSKHFNTRFSYSRGYRIPELKELYFTFIDINHHITGNPNLSTELNDNFQLGIDVVPAKSSDKSKLISYSSSLNLSYFIKSDAIDIVNINTLKNEFKYLNIGDFKGMVANIDNRIKYKNFLIVFGTSTNGFQRFFNNASNQIDKWLFNWTVNGNVTYKNPKWDVKFTALNKINSAYCFVVYNLQTNKVEESLIPAYLYSDFNVSKPILKNKLNITLGVKNLWDIQNLRVQGFNGNVHSAGNNEVNNLWGRTFFTNITLNLNNVK